MRRPGSKFILITILVWLGVSNIISLPEHNVFGIGDWLTSLMRDGWFQDYLNGRPATENTSIWFVYTLGELLENVLFISALYLLTSYRQIGSKLLVLCLLLFTIKDVVFYLHNNKTLLPWLDYVLYGLVLLFVLIRGWRWKYECLTSETRDFRYLQFTIKRPSKLKHLIGAVIKMTPAGTYRALIYNSDTGTDEQWHFPDHSCIKSQSYYPNSVDVVKTALDSYGNPIPASKAREYLEANKHSEYHPIQNNCDNYWVDLCLPSKLFRVSLNRKR